MSNAIRSLLKGKKKSEKNLKQRVGDTSSSGAHSAPAKQPATPPAKSIDDQSYKQWVHDHDNEDEQYIDEEGEEAIVLYNYTPNPSSEENDEIALEKDEIIIVYEQHVSGWWTGQSTKHGYGLFPGAFVRLLSQKGASAAATTSPAPPSIPSPPAAATPTPTPTPTPQAATPTPTPTPTAPAATTPAAAPAAPATGTPSPVAKPEKPAGLSQHLATVKESNDASATAASPAPAPAATTTTEPAQPQASQSNRLSQSCEANGPAQTTPPVDDDEPAPVKKSFSHIVRVPGVSPDRSGSDSSTSPSSDSCSDSLFLKTVLDQLYAKLSSLQSRVPLLEAKLDGGSPGDEVDALRNENADLRKQLEDMKIEKEVHGWRQDKELAELRKEVARLTELTQPSAAGRSDDEHLQAEIARLTGELAEEKRSNNDLLDEVTKSKKEVSGLQQELSKETAALQRERATNSEQSDAMQRSQKQLRDELDELRAQSKNQSPAAQAAPPAAGVPSAMPADFMDHIRSYMEQHTAQMQAELQHLKSEVATKEARPGLEHEVAQLRQALESEQRERAKLRQDLINQMTSSQINRIKAEVLQRAEVKEGKLWDPVNNVFLAADGKWLRPTGIDLSE